LSRTAFEEVMEAFQLPQFYLQTLHRAVGTASKIVPEGTDDTEMLAGN